MSSTKIVLITGANSGVGYAATKVIASASEHFHVIMTGRSMEKVQAAKTEIEQSLSPSSSESGIKGTLSAVQLDVTDEESVARAAAEVEQQHGRIDALINNAAVGSLDGSVKKRMSACFEANAIGPAVVCEHFRPLLLRSRDPRSVFVSSGAGSLQKAVQRTELHFRTEDAYCASKAALNMIAIKEKILYGPEGLKVWAFCPGFVVSNLRGTSEEARTGKGLAGDPMVSGETLLSILQGNRDEFDGKFIRKEGVELW